MRLMRDAFEERSAVLEDVLPYLFKGEAAPAEALIRAICVHQALAKTPSGIVNVKKIRVDTAAVVERFGPSLEVVREETCGPATCPITLGVIAEPWQGVCGHVFEESAVLAFRAHKNACPVLGCGKTLAKKESASNKQTFP